MPVILQRRSADDPDATALIDRYHAELRERLSGFDPALDPRPAEDFRPPGGLFLVAYRGDGGLFGKFPLPVSSRPG